MRAEVAFSMLTDDGKRRAVSDIAKLLQKKAKDGTPKPANEVFVRSVLRGDRSHAVSKAVQRAVSTWFIGYAKIEVQPEDVTGMRERSQDPAAIAQADESAAAAG